WRPRGATLEWGVNRSGAGSIIRSGRLVRPSLRADSVSLAFAPEERGPGRCDASVGPGEAERGAGTSGHPRATGRLAVCCDRGIVNPGLRARSLRRTRLWPPCPPREFRLWIVSPPAAPGAPAGGTVAGGPRRPRQGKALMKNIYVGNLAWGCTSDDL